MPVSQVVAPSDYMRYRRKYCHSWNKMSEDQSSIDGIGHRHNMSMIFVQYFSGMLCLKLFNETS